MEQITKASGAHDAVLLSPVQALSAGFVTHVAASAPTPQPQASAALRSQLAIAASVGDVEWTSDRQQRQGFAIGDLRIMIAYGDGSELLTEMPEMFWVPNAPDWLLGVVNLHGLIVPVFDLHAYWGMDTAHSPSRQFKLLVLGHGADAAGILIDGLPQRLSWSEGDGGAAATALAPEHVRPFLKGVRIIDGKMWFDLDVPVLLNALEQAFLS